MSRPSVLSVVGNRPQFVKAAPLSRALRETCDEVLVHSGQHYDPALADLIIDELGVPSPDHALEVGPGSPPAQLSRIIARLEPVIAETRPDLVLVYGDTTTTLAAALTAAKTDTALGHVEAGLRSFQRTMPEEQNRVLTDHLSELLFCPTDAALANLAREGVTDGVHRVGDVMFDAHLMFADAARARPGAERWDLGEDYLLVTVHRAAATDTRQALTAVVEILESLGRPAVFPVHPRTRAKLEEAGLSDRAEAVPGLVLAEPLGYLDFQALLLSARGVVTDSGGVQKEAAFAGVPCITVRDETEWVETVEAGVNRLTGLDAERVVAALEDLPPRFTPPDLYGDGDAAGEIGRIIAAHLS